jgi:membrane associated rhomboid family serine protease
MTRLSISPFVKVIAVINLLLAALMLLPGVRQPVLTAGALFPARLFGETAALEVEGYMLPAWLTPITSAFLHVGLLHATLNMLLLAVTASNLERVLGRTNVVILYCVGIIASVIAQVAADPMSTVPMVGASGAISALLGAHLTLFPRDKPKPLGPLPGAWVHALKLMAGWVILNLMLVYMGPKIGLNFLLWVHIGGFAAGLALAWPLLRFRYRNA